MREVFEAGTGSGITSLRIRRIITNKHLSCQPRSFLTNKLFDDHMQRTKGNLECESMTSAVVLKISTHSRVQNVQCHANELKDQIYSIPNQAKKKLFSKHPVSLVSSEVTLFCLDLISHYDQSLM